MKTNLIRWMIAAAALTVAAGGASAQTYTAEIPVSFQLGNKLMLPGAYRVGVMAGVNAKIFMLYNQDTHTSAMVMSTALTDAPKPWREAGGARIEFECNRSACALGRIWNGADSFVYDFPGLKTAPGEKRAAAVAAALTRAD